MQRLVEGVGAGSVHDDGGFGVLALQDDCVGNHADVAHKTHQFDLIGGFRQNGGGGGIGHVHAENQLVNGLGFHFRQSLGGLTVNLPAEAALDAVLHRQILALTGVHVIFEVGVAGEENMILAVGADLGGDLPVQLLGTGEAEGTVHKVVLIVDDEQIPVHKETS